MIAVMPRVSQPLGRAAIRRAGLTPSIMTDHGINQETGDDLVVLTHKVSPESLQRGSPRSGKGMMAKPREIIAG